MVLSLRKLGKSYRKILLSGAILTVVWVVTYNISFRKSIVGMRASTDDSVNFPHAEAYQSADVVIKPVPKSKMAEMLKRPKKDFHEFVLVLAPVRNAAVNIRNFTRALLTLKYPRHLLSIAFGADGKDDDSVTAVLNAQDELSKKFHKVSVVRLNIPGQDKDMNGRLNHHDVELSRRQHIAKARNSLLVSTLHDEDWVLWMDSEITDMPSDLVEQLLSGGKDIVAPLCVHNNSVNHMKELYDKNTWRETPESLKIHRMAPEHELFSEGFKKTDRLYLHKLRSEGRIVPVDGVGGCCLLVRADAHREGLVFSEFVYKRHIESEGLAMMAKHSGYEVYGMPFVEVFHR